MSNATQRALRQSRRAAGLCVNCSTPANGRRLCERCNCVQAGYRNEARLERVPRIVVERLPINAAALRSCPICGAGDIVTIAQYGDDRLPSCATCARDEEQVGYPLEMSIAARAILIARTCQGMTSRQIADELGLPFGERDAVTQALVQATRRGIVRHNGSMDFEERRYYRTNNAWRPTVAPRERRQHDRI